MPVDNTPCGPESWKSRGRIFRALARWTPQFVFRPACVQHDRCYTIGGTPADRLTDDRAFLATMRSALSGRPFLSRVYFGFFAWIYYRAVRHYGDAHFNYTTSKAVK